MNQRNVRLIFPKGTVIFSQAMSLTVMLNLATQIPDLNGSVVEASNADSESWDLSDKQKSAIEKLREKGVEIQG